MIIVPITTSMESPVVRAYDVKECRRLYIKSWKMKKKTERTNKQDTVGNVQLPPKSVGRQNGMCCLQEKLQPLGMLKV